MRQCTNCKCQVGSGIAVCPYCGERLPLEESEPSSEGTYIRYTGKASPAAPSYEVTYVSGNLQNDTGQGQTVSTELPMFYRTSFYCGHPEQENSGVSVETILFVLLISMIVVNVFEFIAILLLLLR